MTRPQDERLAVVTATLDRTDQIRACTQSWARTSWYDYEVQTAMEGFGVVPRFAEALARALNGPTEIIACFHDDLRIDDDGWDRAVLEFFDTHPRCGLLGFGGGTGLGSADIYHAVYNPMQLARQDFVSNLEDAEAHGRRAVPSISAAPPFRRGFLPERVACLDGFSQIGRREFWIDYPASMCQPVCGITPIVARAAEHPNLYQQLADLGLVHHAYDAALGGYAARLGWEVWMLPIACKHFGGLTAVGSARYSDWAEMHTKDGDHGFWVRAHQLVYDEFMDVLPIRV